MSFLSSLFGLAPAKPHTGTILSAIDIHTLIPMATLGKTNYAQVRDDYILGLCDRAHTALSKAGIRQWQTNATCTLFAAKVVELAAEEYYQAAFTEKTPADAIAVADFWYRPAGGAQGHAINAFITPAGLRFVDPQVPTQFKFLTPEEFATRYCCRFL